MEFAFRLAERTVCPLFARCLFTAVASDAAPTTVLTRARFAGGRRLGRHRSTAGSGSQYCRDGFIKRALAVLVAPVADFLAIVGQSAVTLGVTGIRAAGVRVPLNVGHEERLIRPISILETVAGG